MILYLGVKKQLHDAGAPLRLLALLSVMPLHIADCWSHFSLEA